MPEHIHTQKSVMPSFSEANMQASLQGSLSKGPIMMLGEKREKDAELGDVFSK